MTNIVPFPASRFRPADRAELLLRWSPAALVVARWFVQRGPDGSLVCATEDGDEYAVLTSGSEDADGVFMVQPQRGRWELRDCPNGDLVATFGTLREVLESVCRTLLPAEARQAGV